MKHTGEVCLGGSDGDISHDGSCRCTPRDGKMYWKGTNASDCKCTAQAMRGREKSNEYNKFDSASDVKDYWLPCEKTHDDGLCYDARGATTIVVHKLKIFI